MPHAWVIQGGEYHITPHKFEANYKLIDPGKEFTAVGGGEGLTTGDDFWSWEEVSFLSRLSGGSFIDPFDPSFDSAPDVGLFAYPEHNVFWTSPVHNLPYGSSTDISASISFPLPVAPAVVGDRIVTVYAFAQVIFGYTPPPNRLKLLSVTVNGNLLTPPFPLTGYPVEDNIANHQPWRVPDAYLVWDGDNVLAMELTWDTTGLVDGSGGPHTTAYAYLMALPEVGYAFSGVSQYTLPHTGNDVGAGTPTKVLLDTVVLDEIGSYSGGTWTCDDAGWYGITGRIFVEPNDHPAASPDPDGNPLEQVGFIRINGVDVSGTYKYEVEFASIDVNYVSHLEVGDTVELWGWHNYYDADTGDPITYQFGVSVFGSSPSILRITKLVI
jgi:hypothetical protein